MANLERIFLVLKDWIVEQGGRLIPASIQPWAVPVLSAALSVIAVLLYAPLTMMFLTWFERKVVARFQDRLGPTRVGPFGLLQPIADGLKMIQKEDIIPAGADILVHHLTPVLTVAPVLLLFMVLPFGRDMVPADLPSGVLLFLALSAVQTPLVISAGWGSRSKYSVLGGMRAAAQILSYEIPMVLVLVAVVMAAGSMQPSAIVEAQKDVWYGATPWGFVGLVIFMVAATAESNRTPFDMAEAESELVGGFHTEYAGFKFALFQMAEFLSAFAGGGLAATAFLGGWHGPAFLPSWVWFFLKTYVMFFILVWFRGTLPRFRIDQLLAVAWKFLFPLSLLVVLAAGCWLELSLVPALVTNVVILLGGYVALSAVIEAEFTRMNRPKVIR